MNTDINIENIRIAILIDIISPVDGFMAFRAIRTDNYQIIKELYRGRKENEKTLATG